MKKPQALIGLLAALGTAIGVLVAVVGLPYGRANYTAFADLYHNGGTPALGVIDLAVDCDSTTSGVQSACNVQLPAASLTVNVTLGNNTAAASSVGSFNFVVSNPDITEMDAPNQGPGCNSNPDLNEAYFTGTGWLCSPDPDDDLNDAGDDPNEDSFLSVFGGSTPPALPNDGVHVTLAFIDYNITGAIIGDTTTLSPSNVAISDGTLSEIGSCNPVIDIPMACFAATITFVDAPAAATATITNTPVPTNTPAPTATSAPFIGVIKVPDCDDGTPSADDLASSTDNSDDTDVTPGDNCSGPGEDPAANLWLCISGPCDDAGEGSLHVEEEAAGVTTEGGIGLGAYEFQVEYDNFVIQSVNPCDIVFGTGAVGHVSAGTLRGPVDEVASSSPANADCGDNVDGSLDGQCTQSLIQENSVRFGCVTVGATPNGPNGAFSLASLELIPHVDLKNDIFPGNNNGVLTIIKDNGCELVDVLGHPILDSINGGLTPTCGDLAVTVRILEGDLDLDCDVDVTDAQLIATKYGSFFGSLIYGKWYDLEPARHDLDIDIKDLQKVFGRIGSACQEPIPAQPPEGPPVPFD